MAFTLAGTVITQTGTDNNLSGLAAIAGVVVSFSNLHNTYNMNGYSLIINGVLTQDVDREMMVRVNTIDVNGTYNFGVIETIQGDDKFSLSTGLVSSSSTSGRAIEVNNGGIFNWNGGGITLRGSMEFFLGCEVNITNGILVSLSTGSSRIRQRTTNLSVNGLITTGDIRFDIFESPITFLGYNASFKERGTFQAVSTRASGGSNDIYRVDDFDGEGLLYIGDAFGDRKVEFFNLAFEGDFNITHQSRDVDPATVLYKNVLFSINDVAANPIQDAVYWFTDFNNGNRPLGDRSWRGQPDENFENDRIYTGLSDVNGEVKSLVLTRISYDGVSPGGVSDGNNIIDHRSLSNDNSDTFPVSFIGYNHNIFETSVNMRGAGELVVNINLLDDISITEQDQSIVNSYTTIDNSFELYDIAKSVLVDNYVGETQTTVLREGNVINAFDLDILINPNAVNPYALSSTAIEINTSSFNGVLDTNGIVIQLGAPSTITYGVNGTLIIEDASGEWFIDGPFDINNIQNNDPTNNLVVNLTNGATASSINVGTGAGQVDIRNNVPVVIRVLDVLTNIPVIGSRVYIEAGAGGDLSAGTQLVNQVTNNNGEVVLDYNFTNNQPIVGRTRRGSTPIFYRNTSISGIITNSGLNQTVFLIPDE